LFRFLNFGANTVNPGLLLPSLPYQIIDQLTFVGVFFRVNLVLNPFLIRFRERYAFPGHKGTVLVLVQIYTNIASIASKDVIYSGQKKLHRYQNFLSGGSSCGKCKWPCHWDNFC
jgi:hypothetical protein